MTKEQMQEAVEKAREILARHEAGTLEPDLDPPSLNGHRLTIERVLKNREAWLRGQVIRAGEPKDVDSQEALELLRARGRRRNAHQTRGDRVSPKHQLAQSRAAAADRTGVARQDFHSRADVQGSGRARCHGRHD